MSIKKIKPEELIGKKFQVVKSGHPKLKKRKTPIELVKKHDMIMDKNGSFTFAYMTDVFKNGDVYGIRQDAPTKDNIQTILKLIENKTEEFNQENYMDVKFLNETNELAGKVLAEDYKRDIYKLLANLKFGSDKDFADIYKEVKSSNDKKLLKMFDDLYKLKNAIFKSLA